MSGCFGGQIDSTPAEVPSNTPSGSDVEQQTATATPSAGEQAGVTTSDLPDVEVECPPQSTATGDYPDEWTSSFPVIPANVTTLCTFTDRNGEKIWFATSNYSSYTAFLDIADNWLSEMAADGYEVDSDASGERFATAFANDPGTRSVMAKVPPKTGGAYTAFAVASSSQVRLSIQSESYTGAM